MANNPFMIFFNDLWNTQKPKGEQDKNGEVGEENILITS